MDASMLGFPTTKSKYTWAGRNWWRWSSSPNCCPPCLNISCWRGKTNQWKVQQFNTIIYLEELYNIGKVSRCKLHKSRQNQTQHHKPMNHIPCIDHMQLLSAILLSNNRRPRSLNTCCQLTTTAPPCAEYWVEMKYYLLQRSHNPWSFLQTLMSNANHAM